jgi:large subunit ribosomal protein L21
MAKFAVIETGGKQYRVSSGDKIKIEKTAHSDGKLAFDKVLLTVDGDEIKIGLPYLDNAKIEGKVLRDARDKKKIVFRYHSKTRYRKLKGHRQHFTEVEIL